MQTPTSALSLPEVLDLKAAAPLAAELAALRGQDLELDAGRVQRLGGQCLQILLSAAAAWRRDGAAFAIRNSSEAFQEGLQLMGATARLIPEIAQ